MWSPYPLWMITLVTGESREEVIWSIQHYLEVHKERDAQHRSIRQRTKLPGTSLLQNYKINKAHIKTINVVKKKKVIIVSKSTWSCNYWSGIQNIKNQPRWQLSAPCILILLWEKETDYFTLNLVTCSPAKFPF